MISLPSHYITQTYLVELHPKLNPCLLALLLLFLIQSVIVFPELLDL
jgi:hypothetical protein